MLSASVIPKANIHHVEKKLLNEEGYINMLPAAEYETITLNELRLFCFLHARYGLPTTETIMLIQSIIDGRTAIEIGAGHGDFGRCLNIPMTDSRLQEDEQIAAFYIMAGQPVIHYPPEIEKLDALSAVEKYEPQVVVGSWVTEWINPRQTSPPHGGSMYGVKEKEMISKIETYILIGNDSIHGKKKIMRKKHKTIKGDFLKSRSGMPELNRIYIWNR